MDRRGISCIITCYNDASFLRECIESIEASGWQEREIIVVDDGSTEPETMAVLNTLDKGPYTLIRKPNGGVGSARNAGIARAKYDWIVAIDVDDQITAGYLADVMQVIDSDPMVDIVYANVERFGLSDELIRPGTFDLIRLLSGNYIAVSAVFRKKYWEQTGGYDENLPNYEDWDFWIGCAQQGARFHYLDRTGLRYRKRAGSKVARCIDPSHRRKVVQTIVSKNKKAYEEHFPEVIGQLHAIITRQEGEYREGIDKLQAWDNERFVKELEQLKTEKQEMQQYYEGSIFWKLKLFINRIFRK